MKERERFASREVPVSIYETDVTEWKNSGELVEFLKETGYTHVEFHPVMEYLDRSSGGYSTSAYYAVTTRFGTAADFRTLVGSSSGRDWRDPGLDTGSVSAV